LSAGGGRDDTVNSSSVPGDRGDGTTSTRGAEESAGAAKLGSSRWDACRRRFRALCSRGREAAEIWEEEEEEEGEEGEGEGERWSAVRASGCRDRRGSGSSLGSGGSSSSGASSGASSVKLMASSDALTLDEAPLGNRTFGLSNAGSLPLAQRGDTQWKEASPWGDRKASGLKGSGLKGSGRLASEGSQRCAGRWIMAGARGGKEGRRGGYTVCLALRRSGSASISRTSSRDHHTSPATNGKATTPMSARCREDGMALDWEQTGQ
jgi:hypothetical protein